MKDKCIICGLPEKAVIHDKELCKWRKQAIDKYEQKLMDETPEEVNQYLRDAGYDPDVLVARMRKRMRKALDKSPLNPKNR
ncbi:hypothetical protein KAR91_07105 [Candidatus Pacearchaeota archaeon]|nr:hypothetical protein [Candidatus Pacearchaeota archaeon]